MAKKVNLRPSPQQRFDENVAMSRELQKQIRAELANPTPETPARAGALADRLDRLTAEREKIFTEHTPEPRTTLRDLAAHEFELDKNPEAAGPPSSTQPKPRRVRPVRPAVELGKSEKPTISEGLPEHLRGTSLVADASPKASPKAPAAGSRLAGALKELGSKKIGPKLLGLITPGPEDFAPVGAFEQIMERVMRKRGLRGARTERKV